MSTVNYKKDTKGFQKIRSLINEPKTVMLATRLHKAPFAVCPMTLLQMDEQGDLWFFTSKESEHFTNKTKPIFPFTEMPHTLWIKQRWTNYGIPC